MDRRRNVVCAWAVFAAAIASSGCVTTQPNRFRSFFLPPAPGVPAPAILEAPPEAESNPFVREMPPVLLTTLQISEAHSRAEALVQSANLKLQHGRGLYLANEITQARAEFDSAVDLLLEASEQDPGDRQEFERRLEEMVDTIHRYDLTGLGASAEVEEGKFDKAPLEDILQMTFPVDPRLKDKVHDQLAATVSQLPLTVNDAVLSYINYFSTRGHGTIVNAFQRSGRYRPMIQRILDDEGLPQELIHLAQAESGFYPRAVSSMAAGGMWQFMKFRGNQYGLNQTPYTDDRMDPEKATRAAAHHLHDLYTEFGDWYLAIAAYNCGPGVVEQAVERTGYADFWELRSRGVLPAETTNYVPIILAMTIMEKNAAEYGLAGIQMEPPLEYDTVEISATTNMALVADITETPLAELAALNPAILKATMPANYPVHVPKGTGNQLVSALDSVPLEHRDSWRMHRVGIGETLSSIGQRFGVSAANLASVNHLQSAEPAEGDRLIIPLAARPAAPPVRKAVAARPGTRTGAAAAQRRAQAARPAPKPASNSLTKASPKAQAKPRVIIATTVVH